MVGLRTFCDACAEWRVAGPEAASHWRRRARLAIAHWPESSSLRELWVENEPVQRDSGRSVMPYNSRLRAEGHYVVVGKEPEVSGHDEDVASVT
jgi:hypothetical protein